MAKRVLGGDPFAASKPNEPASPPSPSRSHAPPKKSVPPKASAKTRASTPPKARKPEAPPPPLEDLSPPEVTPSQPPRAMTDDDEEHGTADAPPDVARPIPEEVVAELSPEAVPAAETPREVDLESAIRDLEAGIDRLLQATRPGENPEDGSNAVIDRMANRLHAAASGRPPGNTLAGQGEESAPLDAARDLLASDYYLRQWGRVAMRDRTESVDEFGLDPKYQARWRPVMDFLYDRWWRVEVEGIDNVPASGPVALVANHAGALPYDGLMLSLALQREHPAARPLRWLAEDFVFHFPFLGVHINRLGAVRACQENAERLLRKGACVGLFPEGSKGVSKMYRERYKLQRFGRGGHIKLALRTRTPIVPVTIVGAEETHPMVLPGGFLAKALGVPYVPITPTFPLLGALGLVPLPSKWKIIVGEALAMDGYGPDAAEDEVLVGRLNEKLRATIQKTLDSALRSRTSVFRG